MSSVLLGALAACGASCLYNVGLALQALDARAESPSAALHPGLLFRLATKRRWLAGTALNILGWPLQAGALLLAPLAVVQPSLAFGLAVLLVVGHRRLGEQVGAREVLAFLGILGGVALLAVVASAPSTDHAGAPSLALALGIVGAIALGPFALPRSGALMTIGAGAALAWSGLSTKLVADALRSGTPAEVLGWALATGLASGVGLLAEMSALQRRPATQVAPVVFVVQVVVPVAVGPVLVSEHWAHVPATLAGVAVVVGSALALLRSPAVRSLVLEDSSAPSDTGASPADDNRETNASAPSFDDAPAATSSTTTSPAAGSPAVAPSAAPTRSRPAIARAPTDRAKRY